MIGLAGAHRTGKTTTARAVARAADLPFLETQVAEVFNQLGIDPAKPMDFVTRMVVQNTILKICIEKWSGYTAGFVSDRTPIDLMMYTLADLQGATAAGMDHLVADYMSRCIEAANRYFGLIVLVQPGIPIEPAPGKAAPSPAYMEHLNTVAMGLMTRSEIRPSCAFIHRTTLDLDDRTDCVVNLYKRMLKRDLQLSNKADQLH